MDILFNDDEPHVIVFCAPKLCKYCFNAKYLGLSQVSLKVLIQGVRKKKKIPSIISSLFKNAAAN